jgi:purine nucleoside phosphorylase
MKSHVAGKSTTTVEIGNISGQGIWILVAQKEYFLPYNDFPWFKDATVAEITEVKLLHGHHLYWPSIDVDLELDCIENVEKYPLIFK